MKKQMKRVSRKALSAIVAIAIVLSCVAVSFSVFAAGTPYLVKSSEPAIPMYVDKAINLSNLSIEIGGTAKLGSTLEWTNKTGVSANVDAGMLIGVGKGNTRFTVSDGVNTQNVWVFVNAQGDNDFTLLNSDFSNPNTYSLNDWIGSAGGPGDNANAAGDIYTNGKYLLYSGGAQPTIVSPNYFDEKGNPVARETLKIGAPNGQAATFATFYKSEVLKDFANYTIETQLGNVMVNDYGDKQNCVTVATGLMVRASLSDTTWSSAYNSIPAGGPEALATGTKSLHLRFRNYGGVTITAYDAKGTSKSSPRNYLYGDPANMYYTGNIASDLWTTGKGFEVGSKTLTPAPQAPNTEKLRTIKVELKDTGIKYTLDGNVIFDTIANNTVYGQFTPVNAAGETGNTIDDTGYQNKVYWDHAYPTTYTSVDPISHDDYVNYYKENLQAEKGTFGFTNSSGMITHVYTVKVNVGGIDTNNMPEMTDMAVAKVFEVPASSPAIPLYVGKGINLKLLNIGIGNGSTTGDKLTWNRISGTAAKIQDGYLVGASAGLAGFTVTDGTNSQNVWAIVNEIGDTDFSLVNFDFANGDTFNANDWITGQLELTNDTYHVQANGKGGATGYKMVGGLFDRADFESSTNISASQAVAIASMAKPTVKTQSGTKAQSALYLPSTTSYYGSTAALYKSEMMKDFLDYTISADISVKMEGAETEHTLAAPGIFARAQLNTDAKTGDLIFDPTNKSYLFRFRNYGGVAYFAVNGSNWGSHGAEIEAGDLTNQWETPYLSMSPGTCYFTKSTNITAENQLYPGANVKKQYVLYPDAKNASELTMRNIQIQLSGKDVKYTLDGETIFDVASKKALSRTSLSYDLSVDPFYPENKSSDLAWTKYSGLWDTNMNVVNGGTIGLTNNFGEGLYVYTLKAEAKNILDAEYMPTFEDVDVVEAFVAPVNTRMNLDQICPGATWVDDLGETYEVKDGMLMVYDVADVTVQTEDGESFDIETAEVGSSTDYEVTTFAPAQVFIYPLDVGYYYAILDEDCETSINSLKVVNAFGDGEDVTLEDVSADDEGEGTLYEFEADMAAAKIEASFISTTEAVKEVQILGATIKPEAGSEAIRFKTRIPAIRNCELYGEDLAISGVNVTYENVGVLLIPKDLLGTSTFKIDLSVPANAGFDAGTSTTMTVAGHTAINVPVVNLAESNMKFSDAWTALNYSATENAILEGYGLNAFDIDIVALSYIQYRDNLGNVGFIYSNPIVRNYSDILATIE